jgi:cytochrome c oxidase subunit III
MSMEIPYAVKVRTDTGMNNARLGLWLFLGSETMLFGGLISAYVFLRMGSASEQFVHDLSAIPLAGINTLILLASSVAITLSVWSLRDRAFNRHRILMGMAVAAGLLFLGLKWLDYSEKFGRGLYPATSTYLAIFFTLTGVHALHVIGGILVNIYLLVTGRKLFREDPDRLLSRVSASALYWNFVDAVWIVLFLLLYVV